MECNEYNQSIGTCQISSRFTKSCRVHEQSIWTNLSFPTLQAHPSVPLIDWTDSRRWLGFHHWGLVGLQYTAASPWKKGGMAWDGEHFFHRSYRTMDVSSYCIYYTFNILYHRYHVSLYIKYIKYSTSISCNMYIYIHHIIYYIVMYIVYIIRLIYCIIDIMFHCILNISNIGPVYHVICIDITYIIYIIYYIVMSVFIISTYHRLNIKLILYILYNISYVI